ncbi:MAG: dockerin type I repeat-containing protein [Candidatus Zixiibacteriota bacterium]
MRILAAGLLLLGSSVAFAQVPDPRDSIILESKTVYPGAHPGSGTDTAAYVYMKVYITNKDTLTFVSMGVREQSISGGAYMTLAHPRTFSGAVNRLTSTVGVQRVIEFHRYHSNSPDSLYIATGFDPLDDATKEPPNSVRKALWEIKFDSVFNNIGTIEIDSNFPGHRSGFTNTVPADIPINFVKAVITVERKGDLNLDGIVSPADVVLELYCVFLNQAPAAGRSACDVNCDGEVTPADVAVFLNYKFITLVWPC